MTGEAFINLYYNAHRIPISLFSEGALLCSGNHTVQDYNLPLYIAASLPGKLPPLWYAASPEQLYFGGLTLPDSGDLLLLGPTLSRPVSRAQASRIICRLGRKETDIPLLMRSLDSFQKTDIVQLKAMLSLLACHFSYVSACEPELIPFSWADIFPAPAIEIHELPADAEADTMEDRLLACIRYGKTDELKRILNESLYTTVPMDDALSDLGLRRQYITGANMLCSRTAASVGLPLQLANEIADFYLSQIAVTDTANGLDHLFYRLITEYTDQVHRLNLRSFSTPFASQVHQYIYAHIYEKLSTREIAGALHISENYLCKIFKQETGMTIVSHIQKCKIAEAEYLLSTHQYTAAAVSDLLCFSSQSYFTSVFRKRTGKTPLEFQQQSRQNTFEYLTPAPT